MVFIFTQPDFHCLHPHRGHGQNLNAWSLLQQSPVTWTLTLVMFGRWKMSKRTKPYNCHCPKIYFHEDWNNHVPAISQLCPYHKSQFVRLCSQSASLPDRLWKASERNSKIEKVKSTHVGGNSKTESSQGVRDHSPRWWAGREEEVKQNLLTSRTLRYWRECKIFLIYFSVGGGVVAPGPTQSKSSIAWPTW